MDVSSMKMALKALLSLSIVLSLAVHAEDEPAKVKNGLSRFVEGVAHVVQGGQSFYINADGQRLFDTLQDFSGKPDEPGKLPGKFYIVSRAGKVGAISPSGEWIIKPAYDAIDTSAQDYWKVTKNKKVSFFSTAGFLLPFEFADANWMDGTHFDVRKGSHWGIYDATKKKMVVPPVYEKFDYCGGCGYKSSYAYAEKDGKWGVMSFDGKELVPFRYEHEHMNMRAGDWVAAFQLDGKSVVISIPNGKVYASPNYQDMELSDGLLVASKDGKYGMLDSSGRNIAPFKYDAISYPYDRFNSGPYFLVKLAGKVGVVKNTGVQVLPPVYEDVTVAGDYFVVTRDGSPQLLDAKGQLVIGEGYSEIEEDLYDTDAESDERLQLFKIKNKALVGMYFPQNGVTIKPTYSGFRQECLGGGQTHCVLKATDRGVSTLFSFEGKRLLPSGYKFSDSASLLDDSDIVEVGGGDKLGLFNILSGELVVPQQYEHFKAPDYKHDGLILASADSGRDTPAIYTVTGKLLAKAGTWRVTTLSDTFVLLSDESHNRYATVETTTGALHNLPFRSVDTVGSPNLLLVRKDDDAPYRLYQVEHDRLLPGKYLLASAATGDSSTGSRALPTLGSFRHGLATVERDGKFTVIDTAGKPITLNTYDAVPLISPDGIVLVGNKQWDKWGDPVLHVGYIDRTGHQLVPIEYYFRSGGFGSDQEFHADKSDYFLKDGLLKIYQQQQTSPYHLLEGVADKTGVLVPANYEQIVGHDNSRRFVVEQSKKYGIVGNKGDVIVPVAQSAMVFQCSDVGPLANMRGGFNVVPTFPALVEGDKHWSYYTAGGKQLSFNGTSKIDFLNRPSEDVDKLSDSEMALLMKILQQGDNEMEQIRCPRPDDQ